MAIDLKDGLDEINSKIIAYKTTIITTETEKQLKKVSDFGDNFEEKKSKTLESLNDIEGKIEERKNRIKDGVKNQYEELIDLFNQSVKDTKTKISEKHSEKYSKVRNTNSVDFLIRQVLTASQNTKSRMSEIFVNEVMKTAGCSQEQEFIGNVDSEGSNKIYIRVNQIDLFKLLNKDPNEGNNELLYEINEPVNGSHPFSMDKELYHRLQNEGFSFESENGADYIGSSGLGIMNIKYVTSYVQNNNTFNGDFLEVTLKNRPNGNRISDFLRDYYGSIDIVNFDDLSVKILNLLTNFVDISVNLSGSEKSEQTKFEKIIQRILGLCFDSTKEIDVSGNSKLSALESLDQSFFELSSVELRNIESDVENMINGVTEFEDCGTVKFPVNSEFISDSVKVIRRVPENQKVDKFLTVAEDLSKDENWSFNLPDGLNLDVAIKNDILKIIPKAVVMTMLGPKSILGLMIVLKSLSSPVIDLIEDFKTFMDNMKSFMVNLVSKIGSIFIEELFIQLKKNLRELVETLLVDIVKESKNAQIKIITSILYVLVQLASAVIDWRQCKSVVDEILSLLNLAVSGLGGGRIPNFALAFSGSLPGYSPIRAMTNVTENLQKLGLPTGDMPDGSPNLMLPSMLQQIKGVNDEHLENSKTETWCAPVPVGLVMTSYIRCSGKNY